MLAAASTSQALGVDSQYGKHSNLFENYDSIKLESPERPGVFSMIASGWTIPGVLRATGFCNGSSAAVVDSHRALGGLDASAWARRDWSATKYDFRHVPKAAGTAVLHSLRESAKPCNVGLCYMKVDKKDGSGKPGQCAGGAAQLVGGHQGYGLNEEVAKYTITRKI